MRVVSIVLITCSVYSGCGDHDSPDERERIESIIRAPSVGIETILDHPDRYDGQSTRVAGEVADVFNPRAFVVEDEQMFSEPAIVVVTSDRVDPMGFNLRPGDHVVVKGIVRRYDATTYERELGRSLEPEVEAAIAGKPVVVARRVGRVHGETIDWNETSEAR